MFAKLTFSPTTSPSSWWNIGVCVTSESQRYTRPGAITASGAPRATHRADLHRRGVRAQQPPVREIERVVHRARGMIRRDVERFEVVEVVFDLGPGGHIEAGAPEQRLDAQARARDGMQRAPLFAAPRQRDVDAARQRAPARRARARAAARRASSATCSALLRFVDALAGRGPLGGGQRTERSSAAR